MENIFEEKVNLEELQKYRKLYAKEKYSNCLSKETQFCFAWCLVRSETKQDIKQGILLLEQLYKASINEQEKRDYLYYIAIGYARHHDYQKALKVTKAILEVEPNNHQVIELQSYIQKKDNRDDLIGLAVVGGAAAVALGGIIAAGFALSKK